MPSAADPAPPVDRPLRLAFFGDPNSIHVRRWTGWFAAHGHDVSLLLPDGFEVRPGLSPAIAIVPFRPYYRSRVHLAGMLAEKRSLGRVLADLKPDVVHAHYLIEFGWHAWISGFHPYAITVWGSDVSPSIPRSLRTRLFGRMSLRRAELVTGVSMALVRDAISAGARPETTWHIHFGVDTERFAPGPEPVALRERLGLQGRRVVFSPRAVTPLYRHQVAVEALAQLPGDVDLLIARFLADEAELAAIRQRAASLGVADRVHLVDAIDHSELPDFYRLADVVLSIPASDATPVTLLEAAACERPIVASDLPGPRELLGDYDPDCLVPVDDAAATARAIARSLDMPPAERTAIVRRGRELVEERAQQDEHMAVVEGLYRHMSAGRRVP